MAYIGKLAAKLEEDLKKRFPIVYDQCSEAVKSRLESTEDWDRIEDDQSLHELINAIQKICVGHANTEEEMEDEEGVNMMSIMMLQNEKA